MKRICTLALRNCINTKSCPYYIETINLYRDLFRYANKMKCIEHKKSMIKAIKFQLKKHRESGLTGFDSHSHVEHGYGILEYLKSLVYR